MRFSRLLLLFFVYAGFICLGLPSALIGVAWPSVRDTFHVSQSAAAAVFLGMGLSCFLTSFVVGRLLRGVGLGVVLAGGSMLVAVSTAGYGLAPSWEIFVLSSILHGAGAAIVGAGLNNYMAQRHSTRHALWLQSFQSLGAVAGPIAMTVVFAVGWEWRWSYFFVGGTMMVLALWIGLLCRWWEAPVEDDSSATASPAAPSRREIARHVALWLQVVFLFVFTGLALAVGNWAFTVLTESRGVSRETAVIWVGIYWSCLCMGRFAYAIFGGRLELAPLLRGCVLTAMAGSALLALDTPGPVPFPAIALVLIGLGLAAIYPCSMAQISRHLGKRLSNGAIRLQVGAAILGGAVVPSVCGYYGQRSGLEIIPLIVAGLGVALWLLQEGIGICLRRGGDVLAVEEEVAPTQPVLEQAEAAVEPTAPEQREKARRPKKMRVSRRR